MRVSGWVFLGIAIVAEVCATSALTASQGLTRPLPSAVVVLGYGLAFWCLAQALLSIPVGMAYAIWSGVGIVLISLIGWWRFGQSLDAAALAGMTLIVAGVLVIRVFSRSTA